MIGPIPGPLAEAFQEFGVTKYYRLNTDYVIHPNLLNHFAFGVNLRDLGEGPVLGLDDAYRQATLMPGVSADKAPELQQVQHRIRQFRRPCQYHIARFFLRRPDGMAEGAPQYEVPLSILARQLSAHRLQ